MSPNASPLDRLAGLGWNASVPPNGFANRPKVPAQTDNNNSLGLATPEPDVEIETTPEHRNLVAGDPTVTGWTRAYDDPGVSALRDRLRRENGLSTLETVTPDQVERATELFHCNGFVAVRDALDPERLHDLREAAARIIEQIVDVDPDCGAGGGAGGLPHRYSFGASSASRHTLHEPAWCAVLDMETTTPILESIFGSNDYLVGGAGGDLAMPGAIEYQGLHSDNMWSTFHDPEQRVTIRDLPTPVVTINFPLIDLTPENGPIRQIAGSHRSNDPIPSLNEEPDWMKLSTICPVPAGTAIFRDVRCWHGGTPNLSNDVRPMPNVEYFAPWFRSDYILRCMPHERWQELSPHGQRISRYVVADPGVDVVGAGFVHPRARAREEHVESVYAAMTPDAAEEYRRKR